MKFISLFSGIGGFDLGLEQSGMECTKQVEVDKYCQAILNRHWPKVNKFGDIKNVTGKPTPPTDLICGGFPCQDISVAGKRKGLAGERSGLWFEFARVIDEFEPSWVVIENVPGLLSSNKGQDFAVIVQWLVKRGYGVAWRILDAQYFGVAQRRRRVFIVASFGNGRCSEVLFEREGRTWNSPPSRKTGKIAGTIGARTCKSVGVQDAMNNHLIARCITTREGHHHNPSLETLIPDRTIGVRRLTPTECEQFQGFPKNWTEGQSDNQRYKQLGNAVAVPCAKWIGERIMELETLCEIE